jgi:ribonuclease Z
MIGIKIARGFYEGELRIYSHRELRETIETICNLTLWGNVTEQFGKKIRFIEVQDGEEREVLGCQVKFFDIGSTKKKQYGFVLTTKKETRLVCCGDEPLREKNEGYAKNCDWLLHEAFCLFEDREIFKPYEKHHSTVKDACELADRLGVKNLLLYHTEDRKLEDRKENYTAEGKQYYQGNLYVPDDRDCFEII